jgi:hypothetical protein
MGSLYSADYTSEAVAEKSRVVGSGENSYISPDPHINKEANYIWSSCPRYHQGWN